MMKVFIFTNFITSSFLMLFILFCSQNIQLDACSKCLVGYNICTVIVFFLMFSVFLYYFSLVIEITGYFLDRNITRSSPFVTVMYKFVLNIQLFSWIMRRFSYLVYERLLNLIDRYFSFIKVHQKEIWD